MDAPGIRFLTNPDLFPLCRALRMLGFDTLNRGNLAFSQAIGKAIEERRIWIRSRLEEFNLQYGIRYFVVSSEEEVPGQLSQLDRQFSLKTITQPFSRCLKDNALLQEISTETVGNRAPEKILLTCNHFVECPVCGRIYWQGSHIAKMAKRLEEWGWKVNYPQIS